MDLNFKTRMVLLVIGLTMQGLAVIGFAICLHAELSK